MTDVLCIECGAKLGTEEDGYGGYEREGGLICWDCNMAEFKAERQKEKDKAEKYRNSIHLEDIPVEVISYLTQANPAVRKVLWEEERTEVRKINIEDLHPYSTSCGSVPNHPFVPEVIKFLKDHSASPFVLAEVCIEDNAIQNLAVKWKGTEKEMEDNTYEFSGLISLNDGSLRAEACFEEGWDMYESE